MLSQAKHQWGPYLSVLHGNLKNEGQAAEFKGLVEGDKSSVHSAFRQVITVLLQADIMNPLHHMIIGPHQGIWR